MSEATSRPSESQPLPLIDLSYHSSYVSFFFRFFFNTSSSYHISYYILPFHFYISSILFSFSFLYFPPFIFLFFLHIFQVLFLCSLFSLPSFFPLPLLKESLLARNYYYLLFVFRVRASYRLSDISSQYIS